MFLPFHYQISCLVKMGNYNFLSLMLEWETTSFFPTAKTSGESCLGRRLVKIAQGHQDIART